MEKAKNTPDLGKIRPNRLRFFIRNYLAAALFAALLFAVGFAGASGAVPLDAGAALGLWIAGTALILIGVAHSVLNYNTTCIYLADEEVLYESGILSKKKISVPLHKITDTAVSRGIADKILGTAKIKINTSGSKGYEIEATFGNGDVGRLYAEIYRLINKTPKSLHGKLAK